MYTRRILHSKNKLLCTIFNNKLTSLLSIREKEYIEEQLELNKTDLPRTWKIIEVIVCKTKTQNNIKHKININGELTSDKAVISNAFNYFVTIGPQLDNKISIAGWDFIPASIAKQSIQSYIKPLTGLINSSFQNSIFPDELKMAKVIPIFNMVTKLS